MNPNAPECKCIRGRWGSAQLRTPALPFHEREHVAARSRSDSYLAALAPELGTVIDGGAGFVLPLVHHLVQQRMQRFTPTMPHDVRSRQRDLGWREA